MRFLRLSCTALLLASSSASADCTTNQCLGSPPVQVTYDVSGGFAVVVNGNAANVTICNATGLVGRAIGIITPDHPHRDALIAVIQASYFLGEPIRIFFENTPGQSCKIRNLEQER